MEDAAAAFQVRTRQFHRAEAAEAVGCLDGLAGDILVAGLEEAALPADLEEAALPAVRAVASHEEEGERWETS